MDPRTHAPDGHRPAEDASLDLRELWGSLRRRRALLAGTWIGVTAAVMLVTLLITPVYESQASVRVRSAPSGGLGSVGSGLLSSLEDAIPMGLSLPGMGQADVATEIGVLGSRRIIEPVADSLALHVSLSRPWHAFRTDILSLVVAGEDAPRGTFTLKRDSDGTYRVSARGTREAVELPDRVAIGAPFRIGPMTFAIQDSLSAEPPRVIRFSVEPFRRMMRDLRKDVKIQRSDAGARLVEIEYRHSDPELARALVNGMVGNLVDYSRVYARDDSERQVTVLSDEVTTLADALRSAEDALEAYQASERIIAPEVQAEEQIRRIAELQILLDAARVEREALTEVLEELAVADPEPGEETPYRALASFPSFISNQGVQSYLRTLTDLENQRAQLLLRRSEVNPDVQTIRGRIRSVEEQLLALAVDYVEGLNLQIESTDGQLQRLGAEVERVPSIEVEFARRLRDRELRSQAYLMLEARLIDARVQRRIDDALVRLVDLGVIEDRAAFPRPKISLALGGMLGLMVALFTVIATETATLTLRRPSDVERIVGLSLFAQIPEVKGRRGSARHGGLLVRSQPEHRASEAVRALAVAVSGGAEGGRRLLIAGPEDGDGRTWVSSNLALALAGTGARVALVDGDLRDGSLARVFGLGPEPGWLQPLLDGGQPEGIVVEETATGGSLTLYCAGDPDIHPVEALSTQGAKDFIGGLGREFEWVLVDSPSLTRGSDAALLASVAGDVLLVLRQGASAASVVDGVSSVTRAGGAVVGAVMNRTDGRA